MTIRVRHALREDLPAVAALGAVNVAESRYRVDGPDPVKIFTHAADVIQDPDQCLFVALTEDDELLGFIHGFIQDRYYSGERYCDQSAFYVAPMARGGWTAKKLLDRLMEWAEDREADYLYMFSTSGIKDDRLGRFYETIGFEPVGTVHRKALDGRR